MATKERIPSTQVTLGKHKDAGGKPLLVRVSYLHVDAPHKNAENGLHEYSTQIWIPKANKEDVAALKSGIDEQIKLHFKDGRRPPRMWNPLKDGDTDTNSKGKPLNVPGHYVVAAKTPAYKRSEDGKAEFLDQPLPAPGVVGTARGTDGKLLPAKMKSGDWGRVSINLTGYTRGDGGVGAYLNNLQLVQVGEPLGGGRRDAADEFADFADDEEDPLG